MTVAAPPAPAPAAAPAVPATPIAVEAASPQAGEEPASSLDGTPAALMSLVVAPSTGRFRPLVDAGRVAAGTVIGLVTGGAGRADEVRIPVAAELRGLLATTGQLVRVGQALAWALRVDG